MKNTMIARRYARALFELALEQKVLDDVLTGMSNLRLALQDLSLARLLSNPLIYPEQKVKLVGAVTSNKLILKFIALLAKRKRLDLLPTVDTELEELADAQRGIHRAVVKTAAPLTDDQRRTIEADLAKSTGGKVVGRFEVAKDLIGGIWVKLGDKVLDATLRGRIQDLRHALVNSTN